MHFADTQLPNFRLARNAPTAQINPQPKIVFITQPTAHAAFSCPPLHPGSNKLQNQNATDAPGINNHTLKNPSTGTEAATSAFAAKEIARDLYLHFVPRQVNIQSSDLLTAASCLSNLCKSVAKN